MPIKNTAVSHHTLRSLEVVHLDRSMFTIQARHQKPSADESSTAATGCERRAANLRCLGRPAARTRARRPPKAAPLVPSVTATNLPTALGTWSSSWAAGPRGVREKTVFNG